MITTKSAMYRRSPTFFSRVPIICLVLIVGTCLFPFSAQAMDLLLGTGEAGTLA